MRTLFRVQLILFLAFALHAQNPGDEHHVTPIVPKATVKAVGHLKAESPHVNLAPGTAPDISQGVPILLTYTGPSDGAQFYWNTGDLPIWLPGKAINIHYYKRPGTFQISLVVIAKDKKQTNEHVTVRIQAPVEFPVE
jgi:hypothetical protein